MSNEAQMKPEPVEVIRGPMIYAAMAAILKDMPAVGKDSKNEHFGYKFRGIDAVANAAHSLLAKHGVVCAPVCLEHTVEDFEKSSKRWVHAVLKMRYTFYAADGSSIEAVTIGEAEAQDDKASNKAMSTAYKYALTQIFCMAYMDEQDASEPIQPVERTRVPDPNKATVEDKQRLIANVGELLKKNNIALDPASLIQKIVPQVLEGRMAIETKDELTKVQTAINSGQYAWDSGERVPEGDTNG